MRRILLTVLILGFIFAATGRSDEPPKRAPLDQLRVEAANGLDLVRKSETIELAWRELQQHVPSLHQETVVVRDGKTGQQVVSQVVDGQLIFQADFAPQETKTFIVASGKRGEAASKVFGRFIPERLDDFAWENDKIAFRMYGPAIEKVEPPSGSGVDVWAKSTSRLVVNDWYKGGDYHVDHGEGLDCYKVGPDRGCGGIAIWKDGKTYISRDFRKWKVLANGPIRLIFELSYEPWDAGGVKVSEVKRISLDAGSNFNRFESVFKFDGVDSLTVGVGLNEHPEFHTFSSPNNQWMAVWDLADQPKKLDNGMNGVGAVFPLGAQIEFKEAAAQAWFLTKVKPGEPLIYYAGAGWSRGGFPVSSDWNACVGSFARRLHSPLKVRIHP